MIRNVFQHLALIVALFFSITLLSNRPLLDAYPTLKENIPHVELTTSLPTPLMPMKQLGALYNAPLLYYKDDSRTGGESEFGGNKVRKLEFLFADAIANKAKAVVTLGAAGSNHALATAVFAQKLGLQAYLLLTPQKPTLYTRRNLLMDLHFQATIEYFLTKDFRNARLVSLLNSKRIYYIPVGGSNEIGSVGFVNAAYELKNQCDEQAIACPDYIYLPYGSYGTLCGLLVGIKAVGLKSKLIGVCTDDTIDLEVAYKTIFERAQAINQYLHDLDNQFPLIEFSESDLEIRVSGNPYAQVTQTIRDTMAIMRETESIQLDSTYSGRAAAALLNDLMHDEALRSKNILFWKTYSDGEYESLVHSVNYKDLPGGLHSYFEEPLQDLDDQGF